jgi:voltage-gated potassium channel
MNMDSPQLPPNTTPAQDGEASNQPPRYHLFILDLLADRTSRAVLVWFAIVLAVGVLVYHWLEGWSYLDALYFCVITLATIGYGDLTPTTPIAKLFTIVYVFNGIGILLAVFDRVRDIRLQGIEARASRNHRNL